MTCSPDCPQVEDWHELLGGSLPGDQQVALQAHLETCAQCLQTLEECAAGQEAWTHAARHLDRVRPGDDVAFRNALAKLELEIDDPTAADAKLETEWALDFLTPSDQPGLLGQLAHYDVHAVIGRGGMGM